MIKLARSEALWIIRGLRLGKFLRCCVRTARQLRHRHERPIETAPSDKAVRAEKARTKPSVPPVEIMKVMPSASAKSGPPRAACKGKRGRKRLPADRLPRARVHAGTSPLDH